MVFDVDEACITVDFVWRKLRCNVREIGVFPLILYTLAASLYAILAFNVLLLYKSQFSCSEACLFEVCAMCDAMKI